MWQRTGRFNWKSFKFGGTRTFVFIRSTLHSVSHISVPTLARRKSESPEWICKWRISCAEQCRTAELFAKRGEGENWATRGCYLLSDGLPLPFLYLIVFRAMVDPNRRRRVVVGRFTRQSSPPPVAATAMFFYTSIQGSSIRVTGKWEHITEDIEGTVSRKWMNNWTL